MGRVESQGQLALRRQAIAERERLAAACRRILEGADTPGHRWLTCYLAGQAIGQPPNTIAALVPPRYLRIMLDAVRAQLVKEFPDLFSKET